MIVLPINSTNTHYEFTTTISDIVLDIRIDYNSRADTWYIEIYDEFGVILMGSRALVLGYNIFNNIDLESLPEGTLFTINLFNQYVDATVDDLGSDVIIMFDEATA